ncbi:MAG: prephenate dehydratase [Candidatus Acidiferrales bacterium]
MSGSGPSPRVAFQGARGAFSEEAAIKLLGERIELVPRPTFDALYTAIQDGSADFILAPIENSLAGSIHRSFDLLLESNLYIHAEVVIPIALHLIGVPGASIEKILQVESHAVALAQCERFFTSHRGIKRVATDDTAGGVRDVIQSGDPARAAIAGRRAAQVYGGSILMEHLEDHRENHTRFLLLSPSEAGGKDADKLSLVVLLAHRPGTLHDMLGVFAWRDINLLKIESRPIPGRPWQYRFFLDLQASATDPRTIGALAELKNFVDEVKVLGCYPQAQATPAEISKSATGDKR